MSKGIGLRAWFLSHTLQPMDIECVGYDNPDTLVGKEIRAAWFDRDGEPEKLILKFDDDTTAHVYDDGQSCCEHRYLTCDDDPDTLVGSKLVSIHAKDGKADGEDGDYHETSFVEVQTEKGFITLTTHNKHNGYYGGFTLRVSIYGPGREGDKPDDD